MPTIRRHSGTAAKRDGGTTIRRHSGTVAQRYAPLPIGDVVRLKMFSFAVYVVVVVDDGDDDR